MLCIALHPRRKCCHQANENKKIQCFSIDSDRSSIQSRILIATKNSRLVLGPRRPLPSKFVNLLNEISYEISVLAYALIANVEEFWKMAQNSESLDRVSRDKSKVSSFSTNFGSKLQVPEIKARHEPGLNLELQTTT